ncbi:hypothetical protein V8G54_009246, partial [Vigna mungo]
ELGLGFSFQIDLGNPGFSLYLKFGWDSSSLQIGDEGFCILRRDWVSIINFRRSCSCTFNCEICVFLTFCNEGYLMNAIRGGYFLMILCEFFIAGVGFLLSH